MRFEKVGWHDAAVRLVVVDGSLGCVGLWYTVVALVLLCFQPQRVLHQQGLMRSVSLFRMGFLLVEARRHAGFVRCGHLVVFSCVVLSCVVWFSRFQRHPVGSLAKRTVHTVFVIRRAQGGWLRFNSVCTTARPQFGSRRVRGGRTGGSDLLRPGWAGRIAARPVTPRRGQAAHSNTRHDARSRHDVFAACYTGSPVGGMGHGLRVPLCVPPRVHNLVPGGALCKNRSDR